MGLLGWVLGSRNKDNESNPKEIAKKLVCGDFKDVTERADLLRRIVERAIASQENTHSVASLSYGKGPIYYIRAGGWRTIIAGYGLRIVYNLTCGTGTLTINIEPRFSPENDLKAIALSPAAGKIKNVLKEVYVKSVADMLASYFGKKVKISY